MRALWLDYVKRVIIAGGPLVGKTTLARKYAKAYNIENVRCTDSVIHQFGWSRASLEVAAWFYDTGPWIVEGTIAVRALRRWLLHTPMTERCADEIVYLHTPMASVTKDQQRMVLGCNTIWSEIVGELRARGFQIGNLANAS